MVKRSLFNAKGVFILDTYTAYLAHNKNKDRFYRCHWKSVQLYFCFCDICFYFIYFCTSVRRMANHLNTMCPVSPLFLRNVCFDCIWCRSIYASKIKQKGYICLLYLRISALEIFELSMLLVFSIDVCFHNLILPVHLNGSPNQVFT